MGSDGMLRLKTIEYVVTVAQCGSIHKAAEKLFVSQPAITSCIRSFEQESGCLLFHREHQHLTLTPAGTYFVQEGKKILQSVRHFENALMEFSQQENRQIHIGMSPFYSKIYFPGIYRAFHEICPQVNLNLHLLQGQEFSSLLLAEGINFCLTANSPQHSQIDCLPLMQEEIVLLYPKQFLEEFSCGQLSCSAQQDRIRLSQLKNASFLLHEESHGLYQLTMKLFEEEHFKPLKVFKTNGSEIIASMVANGLGVGLIPKTLAAALCAENPEIGYFSLGIFQSYNLLFLKTASLSFIQRQFIKTVKLIFAEQREKAW